jgi:septation ring formation regulator EzrA
LAEKNEKIINYVKEAFMWPFHLVGAGVLAATAIATMIALPNLLDMNPMGLVMGLVGAELGFLSLIMRSRRFRRAIQTKYSNELRAYAYVKELTAMYNDLSAANQRRFETFRSQLTTAKKNYSRLNEHFPSLVSQYMGKIDALQMNYVRLLASSDRIPTLLNDNPEQIRRQIDEIRTGMGDDNPKLREIKEKRIGLLQKRMQNYHKTLDNAKVVEQQLKTVEETMKYFMEHSASDSGSQETDIIDGLLSETNDLHSTLTEVEGLYRTEMPNPAASVDPYSSMTGMGEVRI